jgi:hypothetical protein
MDKLAYLLEQYATKGIVKAGEVLLDPPVALRLLDELLALGEIIYGVHIWRFHGPNQTRLGEIDAGMSMDSLSNEPDAAESTVAAARRFLTLGLPQEVELVSFVVDDQRMFKED